MAAGAGVRARAEIVVVGAGIMGLWSAFTLRRRGHDVLLLDAWGPGHARATSADENRVIRSGYGGADLYARWARRSLDLWWRWQSRLGEGLLLRCGVLWMVTGDDGYAEASVQQLERLRIPHEVLDGRAFASRYPQIRTRGIRWAFLEPESGLLLARRACLALARAFEEHGGVLAQAEVRPGRSSRRTLHEVVSPRGERFAGDLFVFACGPWLPRLFPAILGRRIDVTRKEVFYFGTPPGDDAFSAPRCPVWMELGTLCYGIPSVAGRGFKVHPDLPGPRVDPTRQERRASGRLERLARECLARRFPGMAGAPLLETRVCQYESTADDHMILDRHPGLDNVWIVGGGSGHCFKHGPVIGELVAEAVRTGSTEGLPEPLRLSHAPSGRHF